jgi:hypothetical protein
LDDILTFDGFSGTKFNLLKRRWLPTLTRGHHKALDCRDIAEFVKRLRASDNMAALALEFLIPTWDQKARKRSTRRGACSTSTPPCGQFQRSG